MHKHAKGKKKTFTLKQSAKHVIMYSFFFAATVSTAVDE